jgi:hypothetical protein
MSITFYLMFSTTARVAGNAGQVARARHKGWAEFLVPRAEKAPPGAQRKTREGLPSRIATDGNPYLSPSTLPLRAARM